ncbi:MAG TPA: amino acid permease [Streptosporangiaceae bacterium]|nr:amino acid permease [Streptosporangiaceae bacterium]
MRRAVGSLRQRGDLAEGLGYTLKRRLLGKPLINEQLSEQRLSKTLALGVLSPDGISSSAYGTEEILIELLKGGLVASAFTVLLPITGVVLFVMVLVVLSYREVVMVYTRAGGSYVVARDNFGPRVAQIAALALMVDYVVTVAVQIAAGTAAVASAFPALSNPATLTLISIGVVLVMLYGNLRGIREAGKAFAVPTYLFSGVMILTIVVGLVREIFFTLPKARVTCPPGVHPCTYLQQAHPNHASLITFGLIFVMLRAFANGGSSLTGIEAVSNAVSAFRPPEGINARRVLVIEGAILGTLVAGISWLAHVTHAQPYLSGVPTVISQEAKAVFGTSAFGTVMYAVVQAATALILYTGGNTSFNGFPFLANFVAEDAFLPRWLTKRGHRLVFSSGIIVLATVSITLLAVVGSNVNALVPFYALGVFTAFTMAGFGMAKFHHRMREPGWKRKLVINFSAGVTSLVVVLIFAIVKFTEGAWLVIVLFAVGVPTLIRLNRQYRMEATVLENIESRAKPPEPPTYSRRSVYVFIDDFDLATIAALRYARSLRPTSLRAVHFVIDNIQADKLRQDWVRANPGIPLDFVDCPDRRLAKAAANLVSAEAVLPGVGVTAILPRRSYAPIVSRLLHDRTADRMAAVISRIPHAAATIVPFDVRSRVESLTGRGPLSRPGAAGDGAMPQPTSRPEAPVSVQPPPVQQPTPARRRTSGEQPVAAELTTPTDSGSYERPAPRRGVTPIGSLTKPGRAVAEGRVHTVEIRPVEHNTVLACDVEDSTGQLTALFYGRSNIPGLRPGSKVRLRGQVGIRNAKPVMINPAYELLAYGEETPADPEPDTDIRRGRDREDDQDR